MKHVRPSNLIVLIERSGFEGEYLLGMYDLKIDDLDSDIRRFKLWQESGDDLKVYTESVRCNVKEPLRVKRNPKVIYIRRLNPGGIVTSYNREDHLVWWAACVPEFAGYDPANLTENALMLGYSTNLKEYQEVLRPNIR